MPANLTYNDFYL